jgi:hypothetical protein
MVFSQDERVIGRHEGNLTVKAGYNDKLYQLQNKRTSEHEKCGLLIDRG